MNRDEENKKCAENYMSPLRAHVERECDGIYIYTWGVKVSLLLHVK